MWPGVAMIVLPGLVLIGVEVFQAVRIVPELRHSQDMVEHTTEVIRTIQSINRAMLDTEREERGFLITGDKAYLEPYQQDVEQIPALLAELRQLTSDNPEQETRWQDLETKINAKLGALKGAIAARQTHGFDAARQVMQKYTSEGRMRAVEAVIDAGIAAERNLLVQRLEIAGVVALLALILGIGVIAAAFRRVARSEAALSLEMEERRHAEETLRQSQKMEVLGQLTGGIAHDFNNLLGVIFGSLETLKRRLQPKDPAIREPIELAMRGAEQSAEMTRRLLAFSRQQPLEAKPIDANRLIRGMSNLLHRTLGEDISIETVLGAGLWALSADVNQLENALLNLVINARDAMPKGGKLTIETANAHLDESYASSHIDITPGQYVMIAVTDTGVGMNPETVAKAFEPFFTTKDPGVGTGLGLSQVYGFIKQSGGHIKIYSEVGDGTTVRLYLSRLQGGDAEARDAARKKPASAGPRSETILVVEDNELLSISISDMLREQGYRVLLAHDSATALEHLASEPGDIHLLFTDVVLPGRMNGRQLAEEGRKRRPSIKVLFMTGYARNSIFHQGRLDPGVNLIVKPFTYAALEDRIRRLLD
jgi:signal transduction histidine kinase/CheY-like chemotaxis protein